jgi:hypothetical protein
MRGAQDFAYEHSWQFMIRRENGPSGNFLIDVDAPYRAAHVL